MNLTYALITPAWNEEKHLEQLISSVTSQTLLPLRWVIVSDGSTDRTDEIVQMSTRHFPWIRLLRLERSPDRHFAGKAHAVNAGYQSLKDIEFDLVGNLDADITLSADYYEFLLSKFSEIPKLGVGGTPFVDDTDNRGSHSHTFSNLEHVSGACQLFRRHCFDQIGGYRPIKGGGIDWVAVTTARMLGWTTRTFVERHCIHHRAMGTADRNRVKARFRHGQEDYYVGNHPLWEVARSLFQMKNQPRIVGGLSLLSGYTYAWLSNKPNPVPAELRSFHRREQMERIRRMLHLGKSRQVRFVAGNVTLTNQHSLGSPRPAVLMIAYTHYESDPRVIRMAEAAVDGGFAVDVIALKRSGQLPREAIRGVHVYRVQGRYRGGSLLRYMWEYALFFVRSAVMSTRLFTARRYKIVHVHNMPDALVFAAAVPKLFGAKVILDIHDPMPETYGSKFRSLANSAVNRLLLFQERLSVAFANKIITVSEPVKNGILVKHGYAPETIGVVANFADDNIFTPVEYPSTEGLIRFVYHGTILERYGLRSLVEAVAKVRHRERIRIRIIGEGDFSATLHKLIQRYGVSDIIDFVNRIYPLHDVPKLLADCHVGLVPLDVGTSTVANFALPLKLVEYSCLGLPSISIRNAAIEYYFRPDECMFFDSGDTVALARLLDQVAEKPDCLIEHRYKLARVRDRLLWSKEKETYNTLLEELAGHSAELTA